jgi:hypothetical protein
VSSFDQWWPKGNLYIYIYFFFVFFFSSDFICGDNCAHICVFSACVYVVVVVHFRVCWLSVGLCDVVVCCAATAVAACNTAL